VTCNASFAAARSTVEALTFPAVRHFQFDHTWQVSTQAMRLVSSNAPAKSRRRAGGNGTPDFAEAP
jgi:hypothetical protein